MIRGEMGVEDRLGGRGLSQRGVEQMLSHAETFGIAKQPGRECWSLLHLPVWFTVLKIPLMFLGGLENLSALIFNENPAW